jgi:homoserine O-acetyltransferase
VSEARVFDLRLPNFTLEGGGRLERHQVRGWRWGTEVSGAGSSSDDEAPTVLLVHALTGSASADHWWGPVIGPGKVLDPARLRLLCFNLLGSCYGSTGPADPAFPLIDEKPAAITTWDQARSILLALDALRIGRVHLCVGGSLGGMVTLCLAALAPERFERIAPIAAATSASAWVVGWNHVARELIASCPPEVGLSLARQLAMLTYRAEAGLDRRQPRSRVGAWSPNAAYPIRSYLEHQGRKLVERFDPDAYLALLGAMDHHDLCRRPPAPEAAESWRIDAPAAGDSWGLDRLRASVLAVSIDSDLLFFPARTAELVGELRRRGRLVEELQLRSLHGHDAFLIEREQLGDMLARALALPVVHA